MKKILLFVAFVALAGGNVGLLAQPAPGDDEDPPNGPVIVDENDPGIDPAILEDFNENFAPWLQPPGLSIEGLPKPIGFELWKTSGGPELVRAFSNELGAWQAAERAEAEAFSKRTGMPLVLDIAVPVRRAETPLPSPEGPRIPAPPSWITQPSIAVMVGVEHGLPVYLMPLNAESADTIGTDELWETTIANVITNGLSGLNLNGEGTQLAMWDSGSVLTNHQEFAITNSAGEVGSRVIDGDGPSYLFGEDKHATIIAGTLVAAGINPRARGMSPQATLLAYDSGGDFHEMTTAFVNTNNHFRISSHSYGQMTGWGGTRREAPLWQGNLSISTTEDYNFGFYNTFSQGIDDIIYWCRHYLPVWAAGNERGEITGRPSLTLTNGYRAHAHQILGTFETDSEGRHKRDENGNLIRLWYTNHIVRFIPPGGTPPPPAYDYRVNGGYDLLFSQGVAKNNLVVGAVNKIAGGYGLLTTNVIMTDFSSWGPTDDGRIKPDIVTAGNGIYSTYITNQPGMVNKSYDYAYGTSYAAPTVAGSLNLLVQLHRRQVGDNQPMLASTLRALAIHTADEAGDHPGPDYRFGWGLFNALSAANLMTNNFHSDSLAHIKEVPLYNIRTVVTNGITNNYTDYIKFPIVAKGSEPLKVTLCWNDPPPQTLLSPALDPTNRMLINDLDLRLVSPSSSGSQTNFPWVLNPATPAAEARKADNDRDNVEQVVVENPITNGVYEVNVTKRGGRGRLTFPLRPVTGSAMAYTNQAVWTNQWVSLLISGNAPQPEPALEITDDLGETNFISLRWSSVVGRVYQVQCQTNIVFSEGWLPASGEIAATRTNTAVRLPLLHTNAPSCFYRIRRVR